MYKSTLDRVSLADRRMNEPTTPLTHPSTIQVTAELPSCPFLSSLSTAPTRYTAAFEPTPRYVVPCFSFIRTCICEYIHKIAAMNIQQTTPKSTQARTSPLCPRRPPLVAARAGPPGTGCGAAPPAGADGVCPVVLEVRGPGWMDQHIIYGLTDIHNISRI